MTDTQKIKDGTNCIIGAGVGYVSYKGTKPIVKKIMRRVYREPLTKHSTAENDIYISTSQKMLEDSGLKSKGVEIIDVNKENYKEIYNSILTKEKEKSEKQKREFREKYKAKTGKEYRESKAEKAFNKLWEKIDAKLEKERYKSFKEIANGENACYAPSETKVYINKGKLSISTPHELGHALIRLTKKFLNFNSGMGSILGFAGVPVILFIGLLKNKKAEGEKPDGFVDKITTFIKEHCALVTAAIGIPTLVDEWMASRTGEKNVKAHLDKNMYKKLVLDNRLAWSTYLVGTLIACGLVKMAVKIRDTITESKPIK